MERTVIEIDEDKCNGCGACVTGCHEGALQIVDGKAKLVDAPLCDGLGACIGTCPQDALHFVTRNVEAHDTIGGVETRSQPAGCPGSRMQNLGYRQDRNSLILDETSASLSKSALRHWPVQLRLVPVQAPFLDGSDLLICADCVPFAFPQTHSRLLTGRVALVGCPKFDDVDGYLEKLKMIFVERDIHSVTVARMEVPCCSGLSALVRQALAQCGKIIPYAEVIVQVEGGLITKS